MRRAAFVAALMLAAACRKAAAPPKEEGPAPGAVAAGVPLIDYDAATGEFSCRAPGEWRELEDKTAGPRVMFFGPGTAKYPNSVAISISRYPGSGEIRTPKAYWDSLKLSGQKPGSLAARDVNGRAAQEFHYESAQRPLHGYKVAYMKREDVVMIPVKDGFFAISHSAPTETYERTLPIFEAVVASFQPKS